MNYNNQLALLGLAAIALEGLYGGQSNHHLIDSFPLRIEVEGRQIPLLTQTSLTTPYQPGIWLNKGFDAYGNTLWQYQLADGTTATNTNIIDSDGNIYHLDENGYMVRDASFADTASYFEQDGSQHNRLEYNDEMEKYVTAFQSGLQGIKYPSVDFCRVFNSYYSYYESDYGALGTITIWSSSNGDITIDSKVQPKPKSEAVEQFISMKASQVTGNTVREKVVSAARLVGDSWTYAYDMVGVPEQVTLDYAVNNSRGICNSYAMATQRILERLGIQAELVEGQAHNHEGWGRHMWLRCNINQGTDQPEVWMYCDPTWYSTARADKWLDIDYNIYLETYKMEGVI